MYAQLLYIKLYRTVGMHKAGKHQHRRHNLRYDCSKRNACNVHLKGYYEDKVEYDIYNSRYGKIVKRALGVADGTQNRRSEVIKHIRRHTDKVDFNIQRRKVDDVFGGIHQLKHSLCRKESEHSHRYTAYRGNGYRGVNRLADVFHSSRTEVLGNNNACSDRQSHENVYNKVNKRSGRAYSRQRSVASPSAYNNYIRRVVKELKSSHQKKRQGESDYFREYRAGSHIHASVP